MDENQSKNIVLYEQILTRMQEKETEELIEI
jgi:hypothetical protein